MKRKRLKIAFITSEAIPFAKTGGLADVCGALPKALADKGHEVIIIMPRYYGVDKLRFHCRQVNGPLGVPIGASEDWAAIFTSDEIKGVKTYFIEHDNYFGRDGMYDNGYDPYPDNARRFTFFSRGALQAICALHFKPDIIHCNDWQTGLVPIFAKTLYKNNLYIKKSKTLMTIHNIGYQGVFNKNEIFWSQLGWEAYTEENLKFFDNINFLKGALLFSDAISAVSKKYAEEIQTREYGYDLSGVLKMKQSVLHGITNGVDYSEWDPANDKLIPFNYSVKDLSGKAGCKEILQKETGLPVSPDIPLIATISRVTYQKGMDILANSIGKLLSERNIQFIMLGSGDKTILDVFQCLKNIFPEKLSLVIGYNNKLAHLIEAGADIYAMPSRYEPCGLNQMYSLKYGTIPVVRATGGLDDTVEEWDPVNKTGTGFKFKNFSEIELETELIKAVDLYNNDSSGWKLLQKNGMTYHNSWEDAAAEYENLYYHLKSQEHAITP